MEGNYGINPAKVVIPSSSELSNEGTLEIRTGIVLPEKRYEDPGILQQLENTLKTVEPLQNPEDSSAPSSFDEDSEPEAAQSSKSSQNGLIISRQDAYLKEKAKGKLRMALKEQKWELEIHNQLTDPEFVTTNLKNFYQCPICFVDIPTAPKYRFLKSEHAKRHRDGIIVQCQYCAMSFNCVQELNIHLDGMRVPVVNPQFPEAEANDILYQEHFCICGKSFTSRKCLTFHRTACSDEPFKVHLCQTCEKPFILTEHLKKHFARAHNPDELQLNCLCDECGKVFENLKELRAHKIVVHNIQGEDVEVLGVVEKINFKVPNNNGERYNFWSRIGRRAKPKSKKDFGTERNQSAISPPMETQAQLESQKISYNLAPQQPSTSKSQFSTQLKPSFPTSPKQSKELTEHATKRTKVLTKLTSEPTKETKESTEKTKEPRKEPTKVPITETTKEPTETTERTQESTKPKTETSKPTNEPTEQKKEPAKPTKGLRSSSKITWQLITSTTKSIAPAPNIIVTTLAKNRSRYVHPSFSKICSFCTRAFRAERDRREHYARVHFVDFSLAKPFICPAFGCGLASPNAIWFTRHLRDHDLDIQVQFLRKSLEEDLEIEAGNENYSEEQDIEEIGKKVTKFGKKVIKRLQSAKSVVRKQVKNQVQNNQTSSLPGAKPLLVTYLKLFKTGDNKYYCPECSKDDGPRFASPWVQNLTRHIHRKHKDSELAKNYSCRATSDPKSVKSSVAVNRKQMPKYAKNTRKLVEKRKRLLKSPQSSFKTKLLNDVIGEAMAHPKMIQILSAIKAQIPEDSDSYPCPECPKSLNGDKGLIRHMIMLHYKASVLIPDELKSKAKAKVKVWREGLKLKYKNDVYSNSPSEEVDLCDDTQIPEILQKVPNAEMEQNNEINDQNQIVPKEEPDSDLSSEEELDPAETETDLTQKTKSNVKSRKKTGKLPSAETPELYRFLKRQKAANGQYSCPQCTNKSYTTLKNLMRHFREDHPDLENSSPKNSENGKAKKDSGNRANDKKAANVMRSLKLKPKNPKIGEIAQKLEVGESQNLLEAMGTFKNSKGKFVCPECRKTNYVKMPTLLAHINKFHPNSKYAKWSNIIQREDFCVTKSTAKQVKTKVPKNATTLKSATNSNPAQDQDQWTPTSSNRPQRARPSANYKDSSSNSDDAQTFSDNQIPAIATPFSSKIQTQKTEKSGHIFSCTVEDCNKTFPFFDSLKSHMLWHERKRSAAAYLGTNIKVEDEDSEESWEELNPADALDFSESDLELDPTIENQNKGQIIENQNQNEGQICENQNEGQVYENQNQTEALPTEKLNQSETPKTPRAANPFFLFSKEYRSKLKENFPDIPLGGVSAKLGQMWKELPKEEKEKYIEAAKTGKTIEAGKQSETLPLPLRSKKPKKKIAEERAKRSKTKELNAKALKPKIPKTSENSGKSHNHEIQPKSKLSLSVSKEIKVLLKRIPENSYANNFAEEFRAAAAAKTTKKSEGKSEFVKKYTKSKRLGSQVFIDVAKQFGERQTLYKTLARYKLPSGSYYCPECPITKRRKKGYLKIFLLMRHINVWHKNCKFSAWSKAVKEAFTAIRAKKKEAEKSEKTENAFSKRKSLKHAITEQSGDVASKVAKDNNLGKRLSPPLQSNHIQIDSPQSTEISSTVLPDDLEKNPNNSEKLIHQIKPVGFGFFACLHLFCDKTFYTKQSLEEHLANHKEPEPDELDPNNPGAGPSHSIEIAGKEGNNIFITSKCTNTTTVNCTQNQQSKELNLQIVNSKQGSPPLGNIETSNSHENQNNEVISIPQENKNNEITLNSEETKNIEVALITQENENMKVASEEETENNEVLSLQDTQNIELQPNSQETQNSVIGSDFQENQNIGIPSISEENENIEVASEEEIENIEVLLLQEIQNIKFASISQDNENIEVVFEEETENIEVLSLQDTQNIELHPNSQETQNSVISSDFQENQNNELPSTQKNQNFNITLNSGENENIEVASISQENHNLETLSSLQEITNTEVVCSEEYENIEVPSPQENQNIEDLSIQNESQNTELYSSQESQNIEVASIFQENENIEVPCPQENQNIEVNLIQQETQNIQLPPSQEIQNTELRPNLHEYQNTEITTNFQENKSIDNPPNSEENQNIETSSNLQENQMLQEKSSSQIPKCFPILGKVLKIVLVRIPEIKRASNCANQITQSESELETDRIDTIPIKKTKLDAPITNKNIEKNQKCSKVINISEKEALQAIPLMATKRKLRSQTEFKIEGNNQSENKDNVSKFKPKLTKMAKEDTAKSTQKPAAKTSFLKINKELTTNSSPVSESLPDLVGRSQQSLNNSGANYNPQPANVPMEKEKNNTLTFAVNLPFKCNYLNCTKSFINRKIFYDHIKLHMKVGTLKESKDGPSNAEHLNLNKDQLESDQRMENDNPAAIRNEEENVCQNGDQSRIDCAKNLDLDQPDGTVTNEIDNPNGMPNEEVNYCQNIAKKQLRNVKRRSQNSEKRLDSGKDLDLEQAEANVPAQIANVAAEERCGCLCQTKKDLEASRQAAFEQFNIDFNPMSGIFTCRMPYCKEPFPNFVSFCQHMAWHGKNEMYGGAKEKLIDKIVTKEYEREKSKLIKNATGAKDKNKCKESSVLEKFQDQTPSTSASCRKIPKHSDMQRSQPTSNKNSRSKITRSATALSKTTQDSASSGSKNIWGFKNIPSTPKNYTPSSSEDKPLSYKCKISKCSKTFSTLESLKLHVSTEHKIKNANTNQKEDKNAQPIPENARPKRKVFKCHFNDCNKIFVNELALNGHLAWHQSKLKENSSDEADSDTSYESDDDCDIITFLSGSKAVVDKPYKCKLSGCDKAYSTARAFRRHRTWHRKNDDDEEAPSVKRNQWSNQNVSSQKRQVSKGNEIGKIATEKIDTHNTNKPSSSRCLRSEKKRMENEASYSEKSTNRKPKRKSIEDIANVKTTEARSSDNKRKRRM